MKTAKESIEASAEMVRRFIAEDSQGLLLMPEAELIEFVSTTTDANMRWRAAALSALPSVLSILAKDAEAFVRVKVARNKYLDLTDLILLTKDKNPGVRSEAKEELRSRDVLSDLLDE